MSQARNIAAAAAEVVLEPRVGGTCAVYIVETRNRQEIREVKELFGSLDPEIEIRQLAEGMVTSYAVRVPDRDTRVLDEIEMSLKENYRFSISERKVQSKIFSVVRELCEEGSSVMRRVPECQICGGQDPFPTTIEFIDAGGGTLTMASYCVSCVTSAGASDDRELTTRLLAADRSGLSPLGRLRLSEESHGSEAAHQFHVTPLRMAA